MWKRGHTKRESEKNQASGELGAKKEVSKTVNAANLQDTIAGIFYLTEDTLP